MSTRFDLEGGEIVEQYIEGSCLYVKLRFPLVSIPGKASLSQEPPKVGDFTEILDNLGFKERYKLKRSSQYSRIVPIFQEGKASGSPFVLYEQNEHLVVGLSTYAFLGDTSMFYFLSLPQQVAPYPELPDIKTIPVWIKKNFFEQLIEEIKNFTKNTVEIQILTFGDEWDIWGKYLNEDFPDMPYIFNDETDESIPLQSRNTNRIKINLPICIKNGFQEAYQQFQQKYWFREVEEIIDDETGECISFYQHDPRWTATQSDVEEFFTNWPVQNYIPLFEKFKKTRWIISGTRDTRFPHITRFAIKDRKELEELLRSLKNTLNVIFSTIS